MRGTGGRVRRGLMALAGRRMRRLVIASAVALAAVCMTSVSSASALQNRVFAWGLNTLGQLGDGSNTLSKKPVQVGELLGATGVAAHYFESMALLSDGTVMDWGEGYSGQLGNGTATRESVVPVQASGLTGASGIATGGFNNLAVLSDGKVMAWGGFPGDGSMESRDTPVAVSGLTEAVAVAGGISASAALLRNGTVWTWGSDMEGELGNGLSGEAGASDVPVEVCAVGTEGPCPHGPYLERVVAIAAGEYFTLALLNDGSVAAWGYDLYGELGDGPHSGFIPYPNAKAISGLSGVTAISAGGNHADAVLSGGTVDEWGGAVDGNGSLPAPVAGLSGVTSVASGSSFSMALLSNGIVKTWGNNKYGQLGDGNQKNSTVPVQVSNLINVAGIAAGANHALAYAPQSPPKISKVTPSSGPSSGGTTVVINGKNLNGATEVDFGSAQATITADSAKSITVTSPAGTGTVVVNVVTPGGSTAMLPPHRFKYF